MKDTKKEPPVVTPECKEQVCALTRTGGNADTPRTFVHEAELTEQGYVDLGPGVEVLVPPQPGSDVVKDLTFLGDRLFTNDSKSENNPSLEIYEINKDTGALTVLQTIVGGSYMTVPDNASIAYNPTTNLFYFSGIDVEESQAIYSAPPGVSGAPTRIGFVDAIKNVGAGLAFSGDGRLWYGGQSGDSSFPVISLIDLNPPTNSSDILLLERKITLDPEGIQFEYDSPKVKGLAWSECLNTMIAFITNGDGFGGGDVDSYTGPLDVDTGVFTAMSLLLPGTTRPEGLAIRVI